ncbi:hypothetical protein GOC59_19170 [Sinorhizobium medicae]|uniref:hypothetical protein n=1 Tax=Sinorhizobium medicae TaxID=110321 RepID=UPI000360BDB1|nr:hypothetical protein [Sinorhizobium medicae]MDX0541707.1 hypothetical protein [Sinorhizobium medicae]MDX0677737.1 hypothetical protein [Sinorhizobium medicae]MDX0720511.1 hypothetical protein [Sinorhizobium medicae]MDX0904776.1 hypothetical protein [Sinorhizobium medicae]MDX0998063.1 hypothetical protein [Sinorhizobium medicae]
MAKPASNPAQVRGDIQHGRTGDKRRGFDPAAAPLETDAEAAGTPPGEDAIRTARVGQAEGRPADTATEYNDAMRPLSTAETSDPNKQRLGMSLAIIGGAILLGALIYAGGLFSP